MQAHGDQANASPGVEPAVQESQLGRARRELEEAEGGAEGGDAAVGHGSSSHNAATVLMSAPTARARYSGRRSTT